MRDSCDPEPSPRREATEGHYSVLVDIDDRQVVLHDPSEVHLAVSRMRSCWSSGSPAFLVVKSWEIYCIGVGARALQCPFASSAVALSRPASSVRSAERLLTFNRLNSWAV